ncbi:tax1-binding protein 1 homolog B isoform X2 [Chanos chanos]|uniref:Tax1-binding protein 1 homolog B isoform X2 n=1 Tax=Chanos chanos TaxID=29144 RepID=A0A6J2W315_CHACN|nr:tax1-binding protein 1 isoform X2 [Chanos chanos]
MSLYPEVTSTGSAMETSNFAHVIFQNVGKSYLPHAALECHYTLTQFIKPHPKDWVGIFKVGWSTARDYYTFLWSPLPESYTEGTAVNRSVVFQGYYVPNDDGEFYQFCYVTHKGEIRGASTPFQFRASSPSEEELLAVEDEGNSDILVVTTKASYLEQKVEEVRQEKEELQRNLDVVQRERDGLTEERERLQKEKGDLLEEKDRLQKECEKEREIGTQLKKEIQELQLSSQTLQEEREEMKKISEEKMARLLQLEEDLIGVTQKGLQKETELDCLRDRVKKLSVERETQEAQLKNERDEKELYKIHLKNRELENTKLSAELHMLKSVDVNKENTIAQLREELGRLKACLTEKEQQHQQILANLSPSGEIKLLNEQLRQKEEQLRQKEEQLRQKEEQLQATQQQAALLSAELREASSSRDRSMSELYRMRVEMDTLRKSQAAVQADCSQRQEHEQTRSSSHQETGAVEPMVEELQREVSDLRLRLQMAAEHYKEKYKECQRLQKQVARLADQQGGKKNSGDPLSASPDASVPGSPGASDAVLDAIILGKLKGGKPDLSEKTDKYRKCKQMLNEERERCSVLTDEVSKLEGKWKEQVKANETLRLQLAAEEDRYKELQQSVSRETAADADGDGDDDEDDDEDGRLNVQPVFLQYPLPYPQDSSSPLLLPQRPSELLFGNPYSSSDVRDGADIEFPDDQVARLPPVGPPSWDSNVVCIQPARNLSRPDGREEPEDLQGSANVSDPSTASGPQNDFLNDGQTPFCFDSSVEEQKRCPLCEVIFPPHYDQSKFEEHVESHWKVCPMCGEQFPLDCDQQLFEKHVLTHFDGNVLNFD